MRQLAPKLYSWASIVDWQTELQARQLSELPIVFPYLAQMGDTHFGKGAPVGTALPTIEAIIPAAVGVDIGCGMIAHRTQFTIKDVRTRSMRIPLSNLRESIEFSIPSSMGRYNTHITATARRRIETLEALPGADSAYEQAALWTTQLGSLGGGNHFIEITVDEEGRVWLFLHSGSRGVGNRLATKHIKIAQEECKADGIHLVNPDHAFLREGTETFESYMTDLNWAQKFAYLNREEMMDRLTRCFEEWVGEKVQVSEAINCHHNYTEQKMLPPGQFGDDFTNVWLSRKGAIDASLGKMGLIPGSMGVASYVVRGKGNAQALWTAPHGAGRLKSRGAAKRELTMEQMEADMVGIEWRHDKAFLDEAPRAYKDIGTVMRDSEELVDIVHELHPILNVKGQ